VKKSPHPVDKYVGGRIRMRRLMLDVSQSKLANALGVTFQQVQKYEKGTNRVSASRLQQISTFLQVPIPFFFEGLPAPKGSKTKSDAPFPAYISDFFATSDGHSLTKAFVQIKGPKLRRCIVHLVEGLARESD
jgi:transcriptional regulator with XRE-family HTH domain